MKQSGKTKASSSKTEVRPWMIDAHRLSRIADETLEIIKRGSYEVDGKNVDLPAPLAELCEAVVVEEGDAPADAAVPNAPAALYHILNAGSFEAVPKQGLDGTKTAVHNFSNARHIGGGFLMGAQAQEESLCRESTLYASLSSPEAEPYYEVNRKDAGDVEPCNMVYSPKVAVFRDGNLDLLPEPYIVSVLTLAAPDRGGHARGASDEAVRAALTRRLRMLIDYAAAKGIRNLVLGAWGCGAFRNDPVQVAAITRRLLVDEGREQNFDNIVFAVLGRADSANYRAFEDMFRDRLQG